MNKRAAIALGRIAATERIVGALIATHPNPKVLHELWTQLTQDVHEELSNPAADDFHRAYQDALRKAMNRFEEVLRAAVTAQATIESSAAKHPH